jgi:hypothetical protein
VDVCSIYYARAYARIMRADTCAHAYIKFVIHHTCAIPHQALLNFAAHFVANNSKAGDEHGLSSKKEAAKALSIASVQAFCEVAVLLLIITAFSVAGLACIRRFSSALSVLDADGAEMAANMKTSRSTVGAAVALGRQMRKEIVVTTSFVFVAFLLRSVVSTMLTVAFQLQEGDKTCYGERSLCDASCVNVYTHIMYWNTYAMSLFL